MNPSDLATVRLERTFAASPEEVFDAWTNPEVLERWWASKPAWASPGCDVDLRMGGLRADDAGTTVVLEHVELASQDSRVRHAAGWEGSLDNLARRIFNNDNGGSKR